MVGLAEKEAVGLVVVGPEAPLADGLADQLSERGVPCFGPSALAAQLESSKSFSKDFMIRHDIPTARYHTVTTLEEGLACIRSVDYPVVIKASGLAGGKGVLIPQSQEEAEEGVRSILGDRRFGDAGDEVVIEERLTGVEVSLMAFTDGKDLVLMPEAQDHKRLLEGDQGPNTGGMGAFAPANVLTSEQLQFAKERILQAAIDGIKAEGSASRGTI